MNRNIIFIFLGVFFLFNITSLHAQEFIEYSNKELGFSIQYPEDWFIDEEQGAGGGIAISSTSLVEGQISEGAAFGIFISNWQEMGVSGLDEFVENVGQYNEIGEVEIKIINNAEYACFPSDNKENDIWGEIYIHENGDIVFLVVLAYHHRESIEKYGDIMGTMLNSLVIYEVEA